MRVLVFGCGSIGQRHIRALKSLGIDDVYAFRTQKGSTINLPQDLGNVKEIYNYNEAFLINPDAVIISNPTSQHIDIANKSLQQGIPTFIEKPICYSLDEISDYENLLSKNNNRIMVGYVLRYHPLFKHLKNTITSNEYGKVLKADLKVGHYLPFWHPHEDYRIGYAARSELGGGAIRTLSHEIDMANYLFGLPEAIYAKVSKLSDLTIDTDDYAELHMEYFPTGVVNVEMNLLEPTMVRNGNILCEKGRIDYDITSQSIHVTKYEDEIQTAIYAGTAEDFNQMYVEQMRRFIILCKSDEISSDICSYYDGLSVMRIIEVAEKSHRLGRRVRLDEYV